MLCYSVPWVWNIKVYFNTQFYKEVQSILIVVGPLIITIANLLLSEPVEEMWKSVNIRGLLFTELPSA